MRLSRLLSTTARNRIQQEQCGKNNDSHRLSSGIDLSYFSEEYFDSIAPISARGIENFTLTSFWFELT